jgi:hypothetical protein
MLEVQAERDKLKKEAADFYNADRFENNYSAF